MYWSGPRCWRRWTSLHLFHALHEALRHSSLHVCATPQHSLSLSSFSSSRESMSCPSHTTLTGTSLHSAHYFIPRLSHTKIQQSTQCTSVLHPSTGSPHNHIPHLHYPTLSHDSTYVPLHKITHLHYPYISHYSTCVKYHSTTHLHFSQLSDIIPHVCHTVIHPLATTPPTPAPLPHLSKTHLHYSVYLWRCSQQRKFARREGSGGQCERMDGRKA